jgi:hypothetical protein
MKPFRTITETTAPYDAELTDPRVCYAARYENQGPATDRQASVAARAARAMRDGGRHMDGTAQHDLPRIPHSTQRPGLGRDPGPRGPRARERPPAYATMSATRQTQPEAG